MVSATRRSQSRSGNDCSQWRRSRSNSYASLRAVTKISRITASSRSCSNSLPSPRGDNGGSIERLVSLAVFAADAGEALLGLLVVLFDVERLGIRSRRFFFLTQTLIGKPAADPRLGVLRLQLDGIVEVACRRLEVADGHVAQAARDKGFGLLLR